MSETRPSGFWRPFLSLFSAALLVCVIALALALQVVPRLVGGSSLTVLTGSMEPLLHPGDVIAIRGVDPADIRMGDVVTFQPVSNDPALITHRVIGIGQNTIDGRVFTTQGDANGAVDEPIVAAQVRGVYMYRVPLVGYVLDLAGGAGTAVATSVGVVLLGLAAVLLWRSRPPRRRIGDDRGADGTDVVPSPAGAEDSAPPTGAIAVPARAETLPARARTGEIPVDAGGAAHDPADTPPRTRRDARRGVGALVLVAALVAASVALPGAPARADELAVAYAGPVVHLDWRGRTYTTVESSVFGDRVVVPGDRIARTFRITNTGPSDAVLSVQLVDPSIRGTGDLAERMTLSWRVAGASDSAEFAEAFSPTPALDGAKLARGQSRAMTLVLHFPFGATQGAGAVDGVTVAGFDVMITLRADVDRLGGTAASEGSGLPVTGGVAVLATAVAGIALASAGATLLLVRRRRTAVVEGAVRGRIATRD